MWRGFQTQGDGDVDQVTPLRPGAIVVADIWQTEQVFEHKPGMRGTFADAGVNDDVLIAGDPLAAINLLKLRARYFMKARSSFSSRSCIFSASSTEHRLPSIHTPPGVYPITTTLLVLKHIKVRHSIVSLPSSVLALDRQYDGSSSTIHAGFQRDPG